MIILSDRIEFGRPVQVHPGGPKRTFRVMNPDTEEKSVLYGMIDN